MRACSASSSSLAGRSVRWMVKLQPSRSVSARISARWRSSRVCVIVAPGFRAAGGDAARVLPARRIRRGRNRGRFPRPDRRSAPHGPARRSPDSCAIVLLHVGDRAPEIRQHHDFGQRRGREGRRQARARSSASWMIACAILSMTLRLAVGRIRPGMPTRSPPSTSISASAKAIDQRAFELGLPDQRRGEHHRGRAVGPDPHRVRGLPFLLAHIKMIVARRAAPVDARGRLAGDEAADTARNSRPSRRGGVRASRGSRSRRCGAPRG